MAIFIGTTATTVTRAALTTACFITSFSLANKTGGGVTVSVGLLYGSTFYVLYNQAIATANSYVYTGNPILIPIGYQLYVAASGATDYIFTISENNIKNVSP